MPLTALLKIVPTNCVILCYEILDNDALNDEDSNLMHHKEWNIGLDNSIYIKFLCWMLENGRILSINGIKKHKGALLECVPNQNQLTHL